MRRRTFIGLAGAAATSAWPLPACAQQGAPHNTIVTAPNGQRWLFEGPVTNGTYINGDPWVYAAPGTTVTLLKLSTPPIGTGTTARHGGMINPTFNTLRENSPLGNLNTSPMKQGYDGRMAANTAVIYDEKYNAHASLPRTLKAGESLVSAISLNPEISPVRVPNPVAFQRMACVTIVDHIPKADEFRPPYFGTTKTRWRFSDANLALLPNLRAPLNPKGKTSDYWHIDAASIYFGPSGETGVTTTDQMHRNAMRDLHYWVFPFGTDLSIMKPLLNQDWYPRDFGTVLGRLAMYVMCRFADRDHFVKRILQVAIDAYAVAKGEGFTGGAPFSGGAGFWPSPLWAIRFAGLLFDDTDMKNAVSIPTGKVDIHGNTIHKWGELNRCYLSTSAHAQYLMPAGETYPTGKPLYGDLSFTDISRGAGANSTARDPAGVYDMIPYKVGLPDAAYPKYSDILRTTYEMWKVGGVEQTNTGGYFKQTNGSGMGCVLASIAMRDEAFWGGAVVKFAKRVANDPQMWPNWGQSFNYNDAFGVGIEQHRDIYVHGGSGNKFMLKMWKDIVG